MGGTLFTRFKGKREGGIIHWGGHYSLVNTVRGGGVGGGGGGTLFTGDSIHSDTGTANFRP